MLLIASCSFSKDSPKHSLTLSTKDNVSMTRDRAKMWNESINKLDKYCLALQSKKRQRNEVSSSERSNGANVLKMGSQTHQNGSDLVTQRLEDRTKNAVPNKRVRTSVAEVRVCILTKIPSSVIFFI